MPRGEIVFRNGDVYEGELKQSMPYGKGTYRFKNGSYYEGEFIQGNFDGQGKMVDTFSELTIAGQFRNGRAEGRCRVQYGDGSTYEGQMKNGLRCGKGVLNFGVSSVQKVYKGGFSQDQFEGQGELIFKNGDVYRGKFAEGALNGQGEIITQSFSYVGELKNGYIEGRGSIKYSSGDLYEGEFSLNQKHGTGKYTYADGSFYQGNWQEDKRRGRGRVSYANGDGFQGTFEDDWQQGAANWSGWSVSGQLRDDEYEGRVHLKKEGVSIQGCFSNGLQHGLFKINKQTRNQSIGYRGQFEMGHQKAYSVSYSRRI